MRTARNKKYRPKPKNDTGGLAVLMSRYQQHTPMMPDQITDLSIAYRLSFDCMTSGRGFESHWCNCVTALNIGLVLCENGFGQEHEQTFAAALDGAFRARVRAKEKQVWGFDGDAMNAIKKAFAVHEVQLECVTQAELIEAMRVVRKRIEDGNVYREAN